MTARLSRVWADGSVDDVLATWTLCSIPDPVAARSIDRIETYDVKGDPKPVGWTFEGRATAA